MHNGDHTVHTHGSDAHNVAPSTHCVGSGRGRVTWGVSTSRPKYPPWEAVGLSANEPLPAWPQWPDRCCPQLLGWAVSPSQGPWVCGPQTLQCCRFPRGPAGWGCKVTCGT